MIRPLIVSMYDYRTVYSQQTNQASRNGYKMHYIQASAFMGADQIFSKMDQNNQDPQQAIKNWNARSQQLANQPKQNNYNQDYKQKLDEIFKTNNKNYYRNREQQRIISKQKSEDYRSPSKNESYNSNSHKYSSSNNYSHSQSQRYYGSSKQGYGQRYKNDRY